MPGASPTANTGKTRKPRIMVGGEFSAGKTQLINGLTGRDVLPSNVTATALPPVWLVGGAAGLAQVDTSGAMHDIGSLTDVELDSTHFCIMGHSAPVLEKLDIIDTPGSSDPNMAAATWQRMLNYADAMIWCTNATQAWRQTENAVWQAMPERLRKNAMLVITHADLMSDQSNSGRVLQRVEREAAKFFDTFLMVSLLDPADIEGIREHVQDLSERLEISGAEAPMVDQFTNTHKVDTEALKPALQDRAMQMIRPRRVTVREPQPETPPRSASKVVPISVTAAVANDEGRGDARTLWNSLMAHVDRNDPAAILKAADRLVSILDSAPGKRPERSPSDAPSSGKIDDHSGNRRGTLAAAAGQHE
ncbi:MAG: hypothetical protein CR993_05820 [Rhodobacterales bacterium]|nr:MAG: hypothetical protein CR993_05820 [Rhodobacterales bacterium]